MSDRKQPGPVRSYHALCVSFALFVLAISAVPILHGGRDAVAGGLILMSAIASTLMFAIVQARLARS